MCGILGQTGQATASFERAFATLRHRGPDGSGAETPAPVRFAHCRLAIIDTSDRGLQPMVEEGGHNAIVFNGEIYNYRALRNELQTQHTFATESDTEVIIRGYGAEGTSFFNKMRGMWALALHDVAAKKIILSRDLYGIKPLYYSIAGGELVFASEMKAIKALLDTVTPHTEAYYQFFNLGYFVGADTCYKEVKKVMPGEVLTWDLDTKVLTRSYLTPKLETSSASMQDFSQAVTHIREALLSSVQAHFVSDVPVGLLLSGGNDSSLVAALAVHAGHRPTAYTLDIQGSIDSEYATEIAKKLDLSHERVAMTPEMLRDQYEEVWNILDEPCADSSIIPTSLIYKFIHGRAKVVLSGEGGDELFGGYVRHRTLAPFSSIGGKSALASALFSAYGTSQGALSLLNPLLSRARRMTLAQSNDLLEMYLAEVRPIDFPIAQEKIRTLLQDMWGREKIEAFKQSPNLFFDRRLYLPGDLLYKTDIASMAYSIEARVPFLDNEVLRAVGDVDPRFCLSNLYKDKTILKHIMTEFLPRELVYRPKKGFSFSFKTYASDLLLRDTEKALAFHGAHAKEFGLEDEKVRALLSPAYAPLLCEKFPVFAFALVSNWRMVEASV